MPTFEDVVQAFIRMEGSDDPNSINQQMVRNFGKWDVGHLIYAGQSGATSIWINDRAWAGWNTREESVEGLRRDLKAKASRGMTLAQAINAYAPPSENQTSNYISNVSSWSGWPADTPMSTIVAGGSPNPTPPPEPSTPVPGVTGVTQEQLAQMGRVVADGVVSILRILGRLP